MRQVITQRLLVFLPTLLGISLIIFIVMRLIPGDTITAQVGTSAILTDGQRNALLEYYGLDKPLPIQFALWLTNVVKGDFGISVRSGKPVLGEIANRFPLTFELTFCSMLFALVIGIPLGVIVARNSHNFIGVLGQFIALIGLVTPNFWIGTLIILVLSVGFHIFPNAGNFTSFTENPLTNLKQIFFPATTLGFAFMATITRITSSSLLEELHQEYARTALCKGLSANMVVYKHCLPNVLIPIITMSTIQMGYLLGGAIIVEQVYALPGIGQLLINAIGQRDYAVVQGVVLFITFNVLLLNLLADILYWLVDPRTRI